jgi:two-component system chemotaxis response regulator CheY
MIRGTRVQHQRVGDIYVLVLDDHSFMRQVIRMMLGSLGIRRVAAATNVDEAMRILAVEPIDVVISDYRLGDETGAEFMRLVRSMQDGKRFVPLIGCTADTSPATITEMRDAGADEVLAKPVSAQSIWTKLMAVTNARRRFVSAPQFFGPDRRRRRDSPVKQERRSGKADA